MAPMYGCVYGRIMFTAKSRREVRRKKKRTLLLSMGTQFYPHSLSIPTNRFSHNETKRAEISHTGTQFIVCLTAEYRELNIEKSAISEVLTTTWTASNRSYTNKYCTMYNVHALHLSEPWFAFVWLQVVKDYIACAWNSTY